jgi:hypothetical protein
MEVGVLLQGYRKSDSPRNYCGWSEYRNFRSKVETKNSPSNIYVFKVSQLALVSEYKCTWNYAVK